MLYIIINGNRQYLNKEIAKKYGLKPGMRTSFTGYKIFEDSKNERDYPKDSLRKYIRDQKMIIRRLAKDKAEEDRLIREL